VDDRLSLKATARQDNVVYLNGNPCCKNHIMHITHNDSISFLGLLSYYNYKISHILVDDFSNATCRIIQANVSDKVGSISALQTLPSSGLHTDTEKHTSSNDEEKMNTTGSSQSDGPIDEVAPVERVANNTGSLKTSTSSSSSSSCIRSNLLRQFECSICYDTLACAVCLSPCGDNFCYVCIADWYSKNSQCPICQSPFRLSRVVPNRLTESIIREVLSLNDSSSSGSSSEEDLRQWEMRVQHGVQRRKLSKGVEKGVVVERASIATASAPIAIAPIDLASVMPTARSIRPPSAAMEALLQQQTYQHAFQSGQKHRQLFLPTYFNASGSRSSVIHVEDDGRASKRRNTAGVSAAAVTGPSSSSTAPTPHAVFDLTEDSQKQL